ncbi:putative bifunctional diguanylate cyclase/phosphodiesterase [Billgrantia ethanolica]|uniref:EAL domain-containing protein n=1 Tax=Billgrantia ethanolica TaxID=2733486 RepID=A0ABS9A2Z5_9GAMM|nr:EAL domain-containing protein [Halomonas ethanolica]MCE8002663.1 EAL domain-containing protein [Halomonas ethanolica]
MTDSDRLHPATTFLMPHQPACQRAVDSGSEVAPLATVLVVDDDPTIRLLIASGLQRQGYRVLLAADGQLGLEVFGQQAPDLVLVDADMPRLDGFGTLRAIRSGQAGIDGRYVPLLMLTGHDDVGSINDAFDAGATDFMPKPIKLPLLTERVRYALRGAARERALRAAQLEQASACKLARLGFWHLDVHSGKLGWSEGTADMLGWPSLPGCVAELTALTSPAHRQRLETALSVASQNREGLDLELTVGQGNLERTLRLQSTDQGNEQGNERYLVGAFQDVTALRAFEDKALYLAAHDELTGLPKRHCFLGLLAERLAQTPETRWLVAVLDINRLHRINEALGIRAGDQALVLFSRRLERLAPSHALLGRLEAGSFGVAVPLPDTADPRLFCQQWMPPLARAQQIAGEEVFIDYSAGGSVYPDDASDAETLLGAALQAQRLARSQAGQQRLLLRHEILGHTNGDTLSFEAHLQQALQRDEFFLVYQPQQHLADGHISAAEALLRWRHASRGVISPAEFIPLLEESGHIVDVGDWVIGEACRQLAEWQRAGLHLRMSINLSAVQFNQPDFPQRIMAHVNANRLLPNLLELEITESAAMSHPKQTLKMLLELKELGFSIAIDDFGTGHSTYHYLLRFPIDTLKIDRSFTSSVTEERSCRTIVRSLTTLSQGLGFKTIAEGVETQRQRDYLEALDVDEIQGFWLAKPMTADRLGEFVASTGHRLFKPR